MWVLWQVVISLKFWLVAGFGKASRDSLCWYTWSHLSPGGPWEASHGYRRLCECVYMCVCLPGRPARTFGCTPLPWRITGSGRSRASAWQRGKALKITAQTGGVHWCVHMCDTCRCLCSLKICLIPVDIKPIISVVPQNCLVLAAHHSLCLWLQRPPGKMTMSLWCYLEEGKTGNRERAWLVSPWKEQANKPGRAEREGE